MISKKKQILVTGGAGFVGSHLCEELAKDSNNRVVSLDCYFSGSKKNHVKNVEYIEGSTNSIDDLIEFSPDKIFHLGEYSRVEQSFEDIDKVWDMNSKPILKILNFAKKHNSKLIYSGSSTKYSDDGLGRDKSPYAWIKAANTDLVKTYSSWFGLDYAITYFYNVYGGREIKTGKYATLIGIYQQAMRDNSDLNVVSPGTQKRNFTHIDDIVSALVLIGEKGHGDEFGIGSNESYTILEVANLFGGKIKMLPERKGNRMGGTLKTSRTKSLGWKSKVSLREYIALKKENGWK